ncbi:MAG TPA: hypothetical protein PK159_13505, partial [Steroidobacteraceae bacterium]|nr:hypothetical protein [Steroidobacteraceae bacterium]
EMPAPRGVDLCGVGTVHRAFRAGTVHLAAATNDIATTTAGYCFARSEHARRHHRKPYTSHD